ncbi:MAG TPA: ABC transporter permease [Candidatus Sulfotelmatobacter sp.]|nr:ABC transporter permease [Candidatus Sulfotelmatobacter sp.]
MVSLRRTAAKLRNLFANKHAEEDLARELASHLTLLADDFERRGMSAEGARLAALRALGGVEQAKQAHRDERSLLWIEQAMQDLRYGLRTLGKSPGFTITAVLTLAVGIGACTAIFSLVNAVLIRSLPYGDSNRLVYLYTPNPQFELPAEVFGPTYADFYDLKRQSHSFQDLTAFDQSIVSLASPGAAKRISAARVDGDFFRTFQSSPKFGREISPDDNRLGHEKVAVISHALWQSIFGSAADVLHHSLLLDGSRYEIVGVMPQGFEYPHKTDLAYGESQYRTTQVWIPLALTPQQMADRENSRGNAVARLKPGVSMAQAQAEMTTIMVRLDKLHDPQVRGWGALIENFVDSSVGHVRSLLWLLLGAVSVVLLIACSNIANLLLARAAGRVRELGVRVALGAGRSRIVLQLITEALLIGLAAGAIGVALGHIFLRILPLFNPGNIPRLDEASLDMRVLVFTIAVSLLAGALTGVFPALAISRVDVTDLLATAGSRNVAGAPNRVQSALIVVESALVVVLLASAGLLIRSYVNVESVDTGFSQSTVTLNIGLDPRYSQPEAVQFFRNLFARLQALPGVETVGAVSNLPLSNSEDLRMFAVDGYPNQKGQLAEMRWATPNYFSAMRIPLVAGRLFTANENPGAHAIIINQSFATKYFAGRNPIGGRISRQDDTAQWSSVVGVIGDVRHNSLEEPAEPQIYHPDIEFGGGYIAVRSSLPAGSLAVSIRTVLNSLDPNLAAGDIQTMGDLRSEASAQRRFQTLLLTLFAAIALFLALVGLYGLMAYSVSRRTREVGIRIALGAQRSDVFRLVIKKAAFLLAIGLASGLVASWFATPAIQAFLFGVGRHDPITILSVCALLAVSGLLAAMIPTLRSVSINPMQALRTE